MTKMLDNRRQNDLQAPVQREDTQLRALITKLRDKHDQLLQENGALRMELIEEKELNQKEVTKIPFLPDEEEMCQVVTLRSEKLFEFWQSPPDVPQEVEDKLGDAGEVESALNMNETLIKKLLLSLRKTNTKFHSNKG